MSPSRPARLAPAALGAIAADAPLTPALLAALPDQAGDGSDDTSGNDSGASAIKRVKMTTEEALATAKKKREGELE